jgi:FMN-dependent oxidoreductase (nitrilotriacetate monooxygenase family)
MTHIRFHLGFFSKFGPLAWQAGPDRSYGAAWADGDVFVDLVTKLEGAKMDFVFFEDTLAISDAYAGTMELDLKQAAYTPKNDPLPLLPVLARSTDRIGLIATASTSFYPPYLLARTFSTLDSLCRGRVGWNVVTTGENRAAQNFGLDAIPSHQDRYGVADEFMDLVDQLWASWDDGAVVRDEVSGTYVDFTKVHPIHFDGVHYRSRGPLNTTPSPQGRPVIAQAGSSDRGRAFAARHAEVIIATTAGGVAGMKAFRDDIRGRLASNGRDPDSCKVFFLTAPIFDDAPPDERSHVSDAAFEHFLAMMSAIIDIDFSKYDLDGPFPAHIETNATMSMLTDLKRRGEQGLTLRQALLAQGFGKGEFELRGTPETVGEMMIEAMDEIGGDGFLINGTRGQTTPTFLSAITDGLVPNLQAAGAVRTEYRAKLLRDVLREF